ncbi:hypothetical protein B0H19DRAFT_1076520 [Mycena capillaripes]|nr:hypothetical protein B0H19DRAFT_1076520 [Mycena capillaripes]
MECSALLIPACISLRFKLVFTLFHFLFPALLLAPPSSSLPFFTTHFAHELDSRLPSSSSETEPLGRQRQKRGVEQEKNREVGRNRELEKEREEEGVEKPTEPSESQRESQAEATACSGNGTPRAPRNAARSPRSPQPAAEQVDEDEDEGDDKPISDALSSFLDTCVAVDVVERRSAAALGEYKFLKKARAPASLEWLRKEDSTVPVPAMASVSVVEDEAAGSAVSQDATPTDGNGDGSVHKAGDGDGEDRVQRNGSRIREGSYYRDTTRKRTRALLEAIFFLNGRTIF